MHSAMGMRTTRKGHGIPTGAAGEEKYRHAKEGRKEGRSHLKFAGFKTPEGSGVGLGRKKGRTEGKNKDACGGGAEERKEKRQEENAERTVRVGGRRAVIFGGWRAVRFGGWRPVRCGG